MIVNVVHLFYDLLVFHVQEYQHKKLEHQNLYDNYRT